VRKIFATCLQLLSATAALDSMPVVGNAAMVAELAGVDGRRS
jgi:hypothetical protein